MDELFPRSIVRPTPRRSFRRCDVASLRAGWDLLWHPEFVRRSAIYHKMQWSALKELGAKKKTCAAILYVFACYSMANPTVPIYVLVMGTNAHDRYRLLSEMQDAPRLLTKNCKFLWKPKETPPQSLGVFGTLATSVWKGELREAEARAVTKLQHQPPDASLQLLQ